MLVCTVGGFCNVPPWIYWALPINLLSANLTIMLPLVVASIKYELLNDIPKDNLGFVWS